MNNKVAGKANDGWFSVKDSLPEDKTRCFITIENNGIRTVEEGWIENGIWYLGVLSEEAILWINERKFNWPVLAWKPWPKPCEGE